MKPDLRRLAEYLGEVLESSPSSPGIDLEALDRNERQLFHAVVAAHDSAVNIFESLRAVPAGGGCEPRIPVGALFAGYAVTDRLGEGGMSVVYAARQRAPSREVALKVLKRHILGRPGLMSLEREAEALARLQHPGIAAIYEAGVVEFRGEPTAFIAMEMVRGRTVTEWSTEADRTLEQKVSLLIEVCRAVDHAHRRGIIHRDIKPSNVLVDRDGRVRVLDFGIARIEDGVDGGRLWTLGEAATAGTPAYMSPERLRNGESGTWSDVYALGILSVEVLTGRLPYRRMPTNLVEAIEEVVGHGPLRVSSLDRSLGGDLETVIMKALDGDPERRYSTAGSLGDDLRAVLEARPIAARPPTPFYLASKLGRRYPFAAASICVAMFTIVLGSVLSGWQAHLARRAEAEAIDRSRALAAITSNIFNVAATTEVSFNELPGLVATLEASVAAVEAIPKSPDDAELSLLLVQGKRLLGRHLGYPYAPNLGRSDEAAELYRSAIDACQVTAVCDPALTWALRSELGIILAVAGHCEGAVEHLDVAVAGRRPALRLDPAAGTVAEDLFETIRWLVRCRAAVGDTSTARLDAAEADMLLTEIATVFEGTPGAARYGVLRELSGQTWQELGDLEEALHSYQAGLRRLEPLLETDESPEMLQVASNLYRRTGACYADLSQPARSAEEYRRAVRLLRRLVDGHPSPRILLDTMAFALVRLAVQEAHLGDVAAASAAAKEGTDLLQKLLATSPGDQRLRRNAVIANLEACGAMTVSATHSDDPSDVAMARRYLALAEAHRRDWRGPEELGAGLDRLIKTASDTLDATARRVPGGQGSPGEP